ncbi:hypothetical protein C5C49_08345 [Rathayibacter sp. AY1E2]|nr:hypothetical protein C5C49_08345 [Rathayibacter sp. AY1E2]
MVIGYRAVLRLDDSADAIDVAEKALQEWLRSKLRSGSKRGRLEKAEWVGEGEFDLGGSGRLIATHRDDPTNSRWLRRYRFSETNSGKTFDVSVLAISAPGSPGFTQSLVVEAGVTGQGDADPVEVVAPPNIVGTLLRDAVVVEGRTRLTAAPVLIQDAGGVADVIAALTDPTRTCSVIVATSVDSETDQQFTRIVASLTKKSHGVATTFVVSASAAELFEQRLPDSHQVPRGRVRTFLPDVDLTSRQDALRHRVLGPATFARSISNGHVSERLQVTHAAAMKRRFLALGLPDDVRLAMEELAQAENKVHRRALVDARVAAPDPAVPPAPAPAPAPVSARSSVDAGTSLESLLSFADDLPESDARPVGVPLLTRVRGLVNRWLHRDDADERTIDLLDQFIETRASEVLVAEEELERQGREQAALTKENTELNQRIDSVFLDLAVESEALRRAEREARYFREQLAALQAFEKLDVPLDARWEPPGSMSEVIATLLPDETSDPERASIAKRVVFCGRASDAEEVDKRDGLGQYSSKVWEFVHVLHDYAEAKASGWERGTVHTYLTSDSAPAGFKCPASRHAATESESVLANAAWARERVLPVPDDVHPSGSVLMPAHFKVSTNDSFAPRMHYFDDTDRSGRIYIGYIGRHLTNTRT